MDRTWNKTFSMSDRKDTTTLKVRAVTTQT